MRQGKWPLVLGRVLKEKTLGILGMGKVGSEVSRLAEAEDLTTLGVDGVAATKTETH